MNAPDPHTLLRAFADELARCGVEHVATSPGSRSAPLVLALAAEPRLRCWSHVDERCAGFFALGAAKAGGGPAVVVCTSGTAAANLLPAVVEAHHARVPLIVLTADRPPELREIGAGQAIDQIAIYGSAAKWFFEVGTLENSPGGEPWIRTLACRAAWTALEGPEGPVHLNFPLREPLVPAGPPSTGGGRPGGRPWVERTPGSRPAVPGLNLPQRAVIIAGAEPRSSQLGIAVADLAARGGIPLLADPLSGARRGPAAISHYDLLLRSSTFTAAHVPDLVLRFGDLPTSKPLRAWLAGLADTRQIAIDPDLAWQDPAGVVGERVQADPVSVLQAVVPAAPDPGWLSDWTDADGRVAEALRDELAGELTEPAVAALLAGDLGPDDLLFAASSMPIRDLETFAAARPDPPRILANRGANGIDGTISSAFGARAAAGGGRVVLLIGDVALLHDIGGLLAAGRLELGVTIVLIDNDGGGIFHFLPIAEAEGPFEQHVATPHGIDLAVVAGDFGWTHEDVADLNALRDALAAAPADRSHLIRVRTERAANRELHAELAELAMAAIGG